MQITSKKINALNFKVDNDFINMSLFLSAIHNAHWGQPYERVTQLMQKATLSKKVKKIAESYFQEKYKLLPEYFTHYAIPARLKILFEKYIYSYDKSNLVDIILLQAYKKIGFKEDILNVLLKSVEIRYLPDDLVRNYIRPVNLDNNYPSTARNYYYSSLPISKFHFIHGANKDISCNLTCKINSKTRRTIKIYCNDVLIDTILISENWETYVLKISKNMVLKGTNSLEIEWPITDTMNHKSLTSFGDIYNLKLL